MAYDPIDETTMRVVPELCVAATASGTVPEFVCWMMLRHADSLFNDGSGRVRRSMAVRHLAERLNLTERRIRQIIASGMGIFWREGRRDWLYLIGILRLCDVLGVRALISRYITVAYDVVANDLSGVRPLVSAMAACGFNKPTAVGYIAKACGVSERTLQRHLTDSSDMLIVRRNMLCLYQSRDLSEVTLALEAAVESGKYPPASISIKMAANGVHCVMREMPNTYDFVSGRASYGKLRYRLKRRRGIVEKQVGHGGGKERPPYKTRGIMNLVNLSGWRGRMMELTEVWESNAT